MRTGCPSVLDRRALLTERGHQEQRAEEEGWVPGQGHRQREGSHCVFLTPSFLVSFSQPLRTNRDYGISRKRAQ